MKKILAFALVALFISGCKKEDKAPAEDNTPGTVSAPSTTFIEGNQTFSQGGWWAQQFTVSQTTNFMLFFSSQYIADCSVFDGSQLSNFQNNLTFTSIQSFDNQFGYKSFSLAPGTYYVGMRNQSTGSNACRVELDYRLSLPAADKCSYFDAPITGVKNISNNSYWTHQFTIEAGYRYFLDGCNSGLSTYIIPASEYNNFVNNQAFQYYTDYSNSSDGSFPGIYEIKLSAGTYYLCFRNTTGSAQTAVYVMERWKKNY